MEKKIYLKPESEIIEIGLEGSLMMFGSDELELPPKEGEGGGGYSDLPDV